MNQEAKDYSCSLRIQECIIFPDVTRKDLKPEMLFLCAYLIILEIEFNCRGCACEWHLNIDVTFDGDAAYESYSLMRLIIIASKQEIDPCNVCTYNCVSGNQKKGEIESRRTIYELVVVVPKGRH